MKKIVIIEDEEALKSVLVEKFEKLDYGVKSAKDGEEAMPVIRDANPDVILLDLILPKRSGFDVLKELKDDPELKRIPVIVLSNLGDDENLKKALAMGADDYLVKTQHPINEVVEKVNKRLLSKSK